MKEICCKPGDIVYIADGFGGTMYAEITVIKENGYISIVNLADNREYNSAPVAFIIQQPTLKIMVMRYLHEKMEAEKRIADLKREIGNLNYGTVLLKSRINELEEENKELKLFFDHIRKCPLLPDLINGED